MSAMSQSSVSKHDIELLENKISVLQKQISSISKKHTVVANDNSAQNLKLKSSQKQHWDAAMYHTPTQAKDVSMATLLGQI